MLHCKLCILQTPSVPLKQLFKCTRRIFAPPYVIRSMSFIAWMPKHKEVGNLIEYKTSVSWFYFICTHSEWEQNNWGTKVQKSFKVHIHYSIGIKFFNSRWKEKSKQFFSRSNQYLYQGNYLPKYKHQRMQTKALRFIWNIELTFFL